jgi:hypothetical protein
MYMYVCVCVCVCVCVMHPLVLGEHIAGHRDDGCKDAHSTAQ